MAVGPEGQLQRTTAGGKSEPQERESQPDGPEMQELQPGGPGCRQQRSRGMRDTGEVEKHVY